jgi:hypothetical protein
MLGDAANTEISRLIQRRLYTQYTGRHALE